MTTRTETGCNSPGHHKRIRVVVEPLYCQMGQSQHFKKRQELKEKELKMDYTYKISATIKSVHTNGSPPWKNPMQHSLPVHLEAQLDGAQVIDIHSHHLGQCSKQVLGLTRDVPHHHVTGQALKLRNLGGEGKVGTNNHGKSLVSAKKDLLSGTVAVTLMDRNSVMRGRKTMSSLSHTCLLFTSMRPRSFHRWRPYLMKICQEEQQGGWC